MHAQKEDRELGAQTLQVLQDIEPALPRHADVQNDEFPIGAAHTVERFLRGVRLPVGDLGERLAEGLLEPAAEQRVVVGDQHSHDESRSLRLRGGRRWNPNGQCCSSAGNSFDLELPPEQ